MKMDDYKISDNFQGVEGASMYRITNAFFIVSIFCLAIIATKFFYCNGVRSKCTDGSATKLCVNRLPRIKLNVTHLVHYTCYSDFFWSSLFIPKYAAKGDLLYYSRVMVNGLWVYFIVDHKNLSELVTYTRGPLFYKVADLQKFIQIHYPRVSLKECPCGCWSE